MEKAPGNEENFDDLLSKKKWDELKTFLENEDISQDLKKKLVMKKVEISGETTLLHHLIDDDECRYQQVDLIEAALKVGGRDLAITRDPDGDTLLHYLFLYVKEKSAWCGLADILLWYGGKELVLAKSEEGWTPVVLAFRRGADEKLFRILLEKGHGDELKSKDDKIIEAFSKTLSGKMELDENNPIDECIEGGINHATLCNLQSLWYEIDPHAMSAFNPDFNISTSLNKTLNCIQLMRKDDRENILMGPFVRKILNRKAVSVFAIYIILIDFICQGGLIIALSWQVESRKEISGVAKSLLSLSLGWVFFREIMQIPRATFYSYTSDPTNWIDVTQLILVLSMLLQSDSEVVSTRLLISCIAVAWLRLVFISGNISYRISVFVSALVAIFYALIPFLYVAIVVVLAFSHMFHASCPETENDDNWTCTLHQSYFKTFSMFFGADLEFLDKNEGIHSGLAMAFSFIIIILLLNIIIAVISNVFDDIQSSSQKEFWKSRLFFINEVEMMRKYCLCKRHPEVPERRVLSKKDPRGYNEWLYRKDVSVKVGGFIYWFTNHSNYVDCERDDWYEKEFCKFSRVRKFMARIEVFLTVAEWNEIMPPSESFRRVIMGKKMEGELTTPELINAWIISCVFFFCALIAMPIGLALGFISGGYLWPREFLQFFFSGPIENELSDKEEINEYVDELKIASNRRMDNLESKMDLLLEKMQQLDNAGKQFRLNNTPVQEGLFPYNQMNGVLPGVDFTDENSSRDGSNIFFKL